MKTARKLLSVLLAVLMLTTTFVVCLVPPASAEVGTSYQKGDVIEYGSYPQTKVTNQSICTALESILYEPNTDAVAKSYNYEYNGGSKLNMLYVDLYYQGVKYRGVKIGQYRPFSMDHDGNTSNSYQDDNGYELNKWYFFKYEPLQWTVLDPEEGLVLCNSVIDAQIFHNNKNGNYPYNSSTLKTWMNNDFYHTMVGGAYDLNEIERCRLLNTYDVKEYYNDITWSCNATDYAFAQNYDDTQIHEDSGDFYYLNDGNNEYTKGTGYWTSSVSDVVPALSETHLFHYRDYFLPCRNNDHWTKNLYFYYPLYFAENKNNDRAKWATIYANEDEDYKNGNFISPFVQLEGLYEEIDRRPGILTASYYTKYSYHWRSIVDCYCDTQSVSEIPVGDYHVTRGIRPVLWLKKLENNPNEDGGFLSSAETEAKCVRIETAGQGTVSGTGLRKWNHNAEQYTYLMNGQSVTLTATPASGYTFDGWYDGRGTGWTKVSSNAAYTVTAAKAGLYQARFKQNTQVRITTTGSGGGYVNCSAQSLAVGASALFTAYPDKYSYFVGWRRAFYQTFQDQSRFEITNEVLSTSPSATLTMDRVDAAFCAEFAPATPIETVCVTCPNPGQGDRVSTMGTSSFTVADGSDDLTVESVRWFKIGSNGVLTQMANNEVFTRGGNYQVNVTLRKTSGNDRTVIPGETRLFVNGDPNAELVNAGSYKYAFSYRFMNLRQFFVSVETIGDGTGTVSGDTDLMDAPGTEMNLKATPGEDSYFAGWFYKNDGTTPTEDDTCYSTDEEITYRIPELDLILAACFKEIPADCLVSAKPLSNFGGLVTGGGTYAPGTPITVTATPDEGYAFEGWYHEGNLFSTENPCELDVPGMESITLEAKFGKLIRLKKPTDQLNDGDWYFDADATYAAFAQKMGVSVEELIAFTDSLFYNAIAEYDPDSGLFILRDANSSDPNDCSEFRPGDDAYDAYTAGVKQYKAPTQPDNPGQPDNPQPQPDPNMCHWCGKVHEGFFQKIIGFFHNIMAKIFGAKY